MNVTSFRPLDLMEECENHSSESFLITMRSQKEIEIQRGEHDNDDDAMDRMKCIAHVPLALLSWPIDN